MHLLWPKRKGETTYFFALEYRITKEYQGVAGRTEEYVGVHGSTKEYKGVQGNTNEYRRVRTVIALLTVSSQFVFAFLKQAELCQRFFCLSLDFLTNSFERN